MVIFTLRDNVPYPPSCPFQVDLSLLTFQGEWNSQQRLKFLKEVLIVHQPSVFALEEHAFSHLQSTTLFFLYIFVTYKTKKVHYIHLLNSPMLQPQVLFPMVAENVTFDVFFLLFCQGVDRRVRFKHPVCLFSNWILNSL